MWCRKIFTSIAFDSGGVASGPMTATFLLPFAMGPAMRWGGNVTDAFGVVAMVAMTPLVTIQLGVTISESSQQAQLLYRPLGRWRRSSSWHREGI